MNMHAIFLQDHQQDITISNAWLYGIMSGIIVSLLTLVLWGINRWLKKIDDKSEKTDATLNRIEDVLILHGEMFKSFAKRLEEVEAKVRRKP